MPLPILIPLSIVGGLILGTDYRRRQSQTPTLVSLLVTPPQTSENSSADPGYQQLQQEPFSATQHLALSAGLLGTTTVGRFGLPLLRFLSLPGLFYLDLYFVWQAYRRWRDTEKLGIELNDAVLATGLLATRQWSAEALFATFFFTSRKLQEMTAASMAQEAQQLEPLKQTTSSLVTVDPTVDHTTRWQDQVDRGALPLLVLSAVSTPFLGIHRSLSVLLANFGYDYRVLAPLSTLSYLKSVKANGIWIRDGNVLERLHEIDIMIVDSHGEDGTEQQCYQLDATIPRVVSPTDLTGETTTTQITQWQQQGQRVAYLGLMPENPGAIAQVDVVIAYADQAGESDDMAADVILQREQPEQVQQLFALAAAQKANHQRGLMLAAAPSLVNLWGIYFWRFNVIAALLVDYGGMGIGVLNSLWPQLSHTNLVEQKNRVQNHK